MTQCNIIRIDAGSTAYWAQLKDAYELIREAEEAGAQTLKAPMYLHGGYDEDGDVIVIENLAPFDAFDEAIRHLEANDTAVRILAAQRRTYLCDVRLNAVAAVLNGRARA